MSGEKKNIEPEIEPADEEEEASLPDLAEEAELDLASAEAAASLSAGSAAVARFAKDSQRLVAAEDHNVNGGLGSAVCEALAESGLACPVVRVGLRDFGESATPDQLYEKYGLNAPALAEACLKNL